MLPGLNETLLTHRLLAASVPPKETPLARRVLALAVEADPLRGHGSIWIDVTLETPTNDLPQLALSKMHGILGRMAQ